MIEDTSASVALYSRISFKYDEDGETAVCGDNYSVQFALIEGDWCIANVEAEEITAYGMTKDEFDCEEAVTQFYASQTDNELSVNSSYGPIVDTSQETAETTATGSVIFRRLYNKENAVAYAYTYTTDSYNSVANGNNYSFLNSNFYNFSELGGNCQNFVSQCVWAGLYGNNKLSYINSYAFPMDTEGTGRLKWFCDKSGYDGDGVWANVNLFYPYVCNSSLESEPNGLRATTYSISTEENFTKVVGAPSSLIGAVLHVSTDGDGEADDHAVIITGATGTDYSLVTYCGNSPMRKAVKLSDTPSYYARTMHVIVINSHSMTTQCATHTYPTYGTSIAPGGSATTCSTCGYCYLTVGGNMMKPFKTGLQKTITASTNTTCYRIAIGITTPSGTTTWQEYMTTNRASRTYTFSETGLYTITISARDISDSVSDSNVVQHIYTVRTY